MARFFQEKNEAERCDIAECLNLELTELQDDEETNSLDEPMRGTRLLTSIYERCNLVALELANFNETTTDKSGKWLWRMRFQ